jgi:acyl carrier protein
MSRDEIISKVNRLIREHLGVEEDKIVPEANFADDLGADSLDMIELTMGFEEEFGVEIRDDEAENVETVGQGHDLMFNKLRA